VRRVAAFAVVSLAVVVASAKGESSGVHLTIKPAVGTPHTRFLISFTAPATSGRTGSTWRTYEAYASGPSRRGCTSSVSAPVPSARAGKRVYVRLSPGGSAASWCTGRFAGRLEELIRPSCPPREACPAYVVIETLGTFSFEVRRPRR
jgi:hypothetical protein